MIKKIIGCIAASLGAAFVMIIGGITAGATTVEDIWNAAREAGFPEEIIQDYYNQARAEYGPEYWTEENMQKVIEKIKSESSDYLTTGQQVTQKVVTTTTAAPVTTKQSENGSTEPDTQPANPADIPVTLTMGDGTTITRISKKEFIALSYEGKQAYIATFPPDQQQFIIDNLSPEERRSLLKQMPVDKKIDVIDNMSALMDDFGMNLTIQDISDDTVKLTLRNDKGDIVGKSTIGKDIVENTGYDRRWVYATAGGLFIAALAGIILIIHKSSAKENTANERN